MNAIRLLRTQHARLDYLLARIDGDRATRLPRVLQLVEELMTHLSIEDHLFLCRIADQTGLRVDEYRESQSRVRNAMLQAVFAEDDDCAFLERMGELRASFSHHTCLLDRSLMPLVESRLGAGDLETLGDRMQTFWDATVGPEPVSDDPQRAHFHAAE
jgi:hypothetical protein